MNDLYYETYNEGEAPKEEKKGTSKIISVVLKSAGIVLIAAVFFILFYRIFEINEPSGTGNFIFTEDTLKKYDELGAKRVVNEAYDRAEFAYEKESLTTVTLTKKGTNAENYETVTLSPGAYYAQQGFTVWEANTGSYTVTDEKNISHTVKVSGYYEVTGSPVEGALHADHVYLVPAANEVQLTFRYKNNALTKLDGHTMSDGSFFRYSIEDDAGNTYSSYYYKTDKKGVYRYITMVFDGVDLSSVEKLTLNIGYIASDFSDAELQIAIYDSALPLPLKKTDISRSDAQALSRKDQ